MKYDVDDSVSGLDALKFNPILQVNNVNIIHASDNLYGHTKHAHLVVSGPCWSFQYKTNDRQDIQQFPQIIQRLLETDTEFIGRRSPNAGPDLTILQLANCKPSHKLVGISGNKSDFVLFYLLILESVKDHAQESPYACFRRVGLIRLELYNSGWRLYGVEGVKVLKEIMAQPWPLRP